MKSKLASPNIKRVTFHIRGTSPLVLLKFPRTFNYKSLVNTFEVVSAKEVKA